MQNLMLVDTGFDGLEQTEFEQRKSNVDRQDTDANEMDFKDQTNNTQFATDELSSQIDPDG